MNDYMLMEYLKHQEMQKGMSEHDFMDKFQEFMSKYKRNSMPYESEQDLKDWEYKNYMKRHNSFPDDFKMFYFGNKNRAYDRFYRMNKEQEFYNEGDMYNEYPEHFNESYAKFIVSNMHHLENGRKHVGEKYDMNKAKEVYEKYKGMLNKDLTCADIYVAINAQYHDYSELFKRWFGMNIDHKIIESAIVFWFKDEDYDKGSKLWNYFSEK